MKYFIGTSLTMVYGQKNTMINLQRYYHDIFGCVAVEVAVIVGLAQGKYGTMLHFVIL